MEIDAKGQGEREFVSSSQSCAENLRHVSQGEKAHLQADIQTRTDGNDETREFFGDAMRFDFKTKFLEQLCSKPHKSACAPHKPACRTTGNRSVFGTTYRAWTGRPRDPRAHTAEAADEIWRSTPRVVSQNAISTSSARVHADTSDCAVLASLCMPQPHSPGSRVDSTFKHGHHQRIYCRMHAFGFGQQRSDGAHNSSLDKLAQLQENARK